MSISSFCSRWLMTPVADQGNSSTCVSCTVSALLSSIWAIEWTSRNVKAPLLSMQHLVDCLPIGESGTTFHDAFQFVHHQGLHRGREYPYTAKHSEECKSRYLLGMPRVTFDTYIPLYTVGDALKALGGNGGAPVAAGMMLYSSFINHTPQHTDVLDVYSHRSDEVPLKDSNNIPLQHAVLIVGYGTYKGKDCFFIKNSYGLGWGANGYARVDPNILHEFATVRKIRLIE